MKKKILVIYYSQTGQLTDILNEFCRPFETEGIILEKRCVQTRAPYPFPWDSISFFAAMPDAVLGVPTELREFRLSHEKYDLIIFGYQPWFLSPSIPATSILKHSDIKRIIADTPVLTIIGARNMWLNAQEKVKAMLRDAGAKLVGNIALIDRHHNLSSAVSIVNWLLYGNKGRLLGIFPPAGISTDDIKHSSIFGQKVLEHLHSGNWETLQKELVAMRALEIKSNIMFIESKAGRLFSIWANFIATRKNKTFWLKVFKYYLAIALFVASPIVLFIDMLLIRPFMIKRLKQRKNYYLGLN